jgi:hypothetical protein
VQAKSGESTGVAELPLWLWRILHFLCKYTGKATEKHSKCRMAIAILQASLYNIPRRYDGEAVHPLAYFERRFPLWLVMLSAF